MTKVVSQEDRDSCQLPVHQMLTSLTFCSLETRHCKCFLRARVLEGFLSLPVMEDNMAHWLVRHESDWRSCDLCLIYLKTKRKVRAQSPS